MIYGVIKNPDYYQGFLLYYKSDIITKLAKNKIHLK